MVKNKKFYFHLHKKVRNEREKEEEKKNLKHLPKQNTSNAV